MARHEIVGGRDGVWPLGVCPPRLTGREREFAVLADALAGPPVVVLVEGEAGIGKSRLVREVLDSEPKRQDGAVVAQCPPFRRPHTLGPLLDALRQAAANGVAELGLSGLAGVLRPLFPEWEPGLPPAVERVEDATAARHRVFAALAELLRCLQTGLLVFEDAHWADEASLEFLLYLVSRRPPPLHLVVTSRPEDVPAGSLLRWLARLTAGGGGVRITLDPLDTAQTAGLMSSMLADERVSEEFAGFMHEHTGGVPLAVEESVRLMAARADLRRQGGQWVRRELAELSVPPPVRDAVLERSEQLAEDAQAVLHAAAVVGEPASEATLTAVTGICGERLRPALSQALASGLLAYDHRGLVSFRHALAARAVHESIPRPDRRLLHERAGQALEALAPAPVAALARHFREARDMPRWLRYAERAADLALAAGDEATAAVLLHELVTEARLPAPDVSRLAGQMVLLALPGDDRLASLAAALRTVLGSGGLTPSLEAGLRFQLGRTLTTMDEAKASRAELEQAVAGLPPDSLQAVRAMMLLGWPQDGDNPAAEHLRWLRRAAASEASVPPGERLRLVVDRASALLLLGEAEGWAEVARIPWDAPTPRDRLQVTRAQGNIGESALMWGRYGEARRRLEHAVALADAYHYERLRSGMLVMLARLDWLTGAWAGLAGRAAALAGDDDLSPSDRLWAIQVGGLLRSAAGAGEQELQDLSRVCDDVVRRGAPADLMEPAAALARMYLAQGDVNQALAVTGNGMDVVVRKGVWLWAADLAPARVAALAAADRIAEAAVLADAFAAGLVGRTIPAASAGLAQCRAFLAEANGEPAAAAILFGRAAAAWQALPRPYDALLARERQARCLLAAGRQGRGLAMLTGIMRGLSQLGASCDAARVAQMLRENGIQARRPVPGRPSYGNRLSPRELEVVRLLVAGRHSRDIASELFLSPKTVGRHIGSAMRKLGAGSRATLAVKALQMGIIPASPDRASADRGSRLRSASRAVTFLSRLGTFLSPCPMVT